MKFNQHTFKKLFATKLCAALMLVAVAGGEPPEPAADCATLSSGGVVMSDGAVMIVGQTVAGVTSNNQFSAHFGTIHCLSAAGGPVECIGDSDDSGTVDVVDMLQLLSDWGPCIGCPSDTNNDGVVDVIDLLALLANWGPCV